MKIIQINVVHSQPLDRLCKGLRHVRWVSINDLARRRTEAELGGEEYLGTFTRFLNLSHGGVSK